MTVSRRMPNFALRCMSFYTSKLDSIHNVNPLNDDDIGDLTMSLFKKANGTWVAATDIDATKTVIDWEPQYNSEMIGGTLDLPSGLAGGSTDEWFLACIGVPDYPSQYGGSLVYLTETNLEAVTRTHVDLDGRATSYMAYNFGGAPHTNRIRFIFKHPAGAQKRFQIQIDHFV